MGMGTVITALVLSQGSAAAAQADVAFAALATGDDRAAVAQLQASDREADPARLINLGIAYARQGQTARARDAFARAAAADERVDLETAGGNWVDSRKLALRALAALDGGRLAPETRTAMR